MMRTLRRMLRPYQGFFVPAGILTLTAIIVFFGIIPGAKRTWTLFGLANSERSEVNDLRSKVAFLDSLDEATLFDQLFILSSAIPVDKSIPAIFSTVDGVSGKTGTIFLSLQLGNPGSLATEAARRQTTEEAALGSFLLPFALTIEGSPQQLSDTFASFVSGRRLFRIKNFMITFANPTVGRAIVSMDAFYAPPPKSTGGGKKLVPLQPKEEALLSRVASLPLFSKELVAGPAPLGTQREDPFAP